MPAPNSTTLPLPKIYSQVCDYMPAPGSTPSLRLTVRSVTECRLLVQSMALALDMTVAACRLQAQPRRHELDMLEKS